MLWASFVGDVFGAVLGTIGLTGVIAIFLMVKLFQATKGVPGPVKRAGLNYAAKKFFG